MFEKLALRRRNVFSYLCRAVNRSGAISMSKVNQIDAILLGVNCSGLGSFLAVVEHNLIIIATTGISE